MPRIWQDASDVAQDIQNVGSRSELFARVVEILTGERGTPDERKSLVDALGRDANPI